jgi:hypothetical protein
MRLVSPERIEPSSDDLDNSLMGARVLAKSLSSFEFVSHLRSPRINASRPESTPVVERFGRRQHRSKCGHCVVCGGETAGCERKRWNRFASRP